jgi:hypothetical protein
LSREELVIANAALSLSKICMQVLKVCTVTQGFKSSRYPPPSFPHLPAKLTRNVCRQVGVKKLMGGAVTGCSAHYEDLSQVPLTTSALPCTSGSPPIFCANYHFSHSRAHFSMLGAFAMICLSFSDDASSKSRLVLRVRAQYPKP